jgi:hypothetical protein
MGIALAIVLATEGVDMNPGKNLPSAPGCDDTIVEIMVYVYEHIASR